MKAHSVLYKEFLNESFGECLNCVNSFVESYFLFESKLVLGRDTILSEEGGQLLQIYEAIFKIATLTCHSAWSTYFGVTSFCGTEV